MANELFLTIALRKEIASIPEAEALTDIVRVKLADHPEVDIKASVGVHLEDPPE